MEFQVLKPYLPVLQTRMGENRIRYIILLGGRGAGRSYFASQLILGLMRSERYFRCAIMRFILGDIRNSTYQELLDRIDEQGAEKEFNVKEGGLEIEYQGNSVKGIGFRKSSGDQKSKLKSLASFNYIDIEEADEIAEEDFLQLDDSLRTIKGNITVMLRLNPPDKNHWIIKRWFNLVPSGIEGFYTPVLKDSEKDTTLFVNTNWKDNAKNLNQSTKDNYIRYKETRPDYYFNMIEGLVSEGVRGRVFKDWKVITDKEYEELPQQEIYGMDFGFTNDPTALVAIKIHNNKVYARELLYETGLINKRIAERFGDLQMKRGSPNYADSQEPKSIKELRDMDWNVIGATKGADSVKAGIDYLLGMEVHYTESSKNIAIEIQNYTWALDRNKEPTNDPVDKFNHLMDAIRYAICTHQKRAFVGIA